MSLLRLTTNFLGPRLRRAAEVAGLLTGLLASAPVAWWAWRTFVRSVETGSYYFGEINLPEWPAKLFFFIAFFTVSLRLGLMLAQTLAGEAGDARASEGSG